MYEILPYTYKKAKDLGVVVKPSKKPKYKLDVYDKNGVFITSCGSAEYEDFPHYIQSRGQAYADKRRALYKIRHQKDRLIKGSRGYYADQLLW